MLKRLVAHTLESSTYLEVSKDGKKVAIFTEKINGKEPTKIAEFIMEDVWDMIIDSISTIDVEPISNPGLFRRKGEALAGLLHTTKIMGGK